MQKDDAIWAAYSGWLIASGIHPHSDTIRIADAFKAGYSAGRRIPTDSTRPDYDLRCEECNRAHILDTVIPSEIWNQIAERHSLLCTLCIDRRLSAQNLKAEAEFYFVGSALTSKLYDDKSEASAALSSVQPVPGVTEAIGAAEAIFADAELLEIAIRDCDPRPELMLRAKDICAAILKLRDSLEVLPTPQPVEGPREPVAKDCYPCEGTGTLRGGAQCSQCGGKGKWFPPSPAQGTVEPIAYEYEWFGNPTGGRDQWTPAVSHFLPDASDTNVRNIRPLAYADLASPPVDSDELKALRPLSTVSKSDKPEWQQINDLFRRCNMPAPHTQLRDELTTILAWARYAEVLDAALSSQEIANG